VVFTGESLGTAAISAPTGIARQPAPEQRRCLPVAPRDEPAAPRGVALLPVAHRAEPAPPLF
jgi:hypothetical protein